MAAINNRALVLITVAVFIFLFSMSCSKRISWSEESLSSLVASDAGTDQCRLFTTKILPILEERHRRLLSDYTMCSGKTSYCEAAMSLTKAALLYEMYFAENEQTFVKFRNMFNILADSSMAFSGAVENIDEYVIRTILVSLETETNPEWSLVLSILLPEKRSAIANVKGIVCSELRSGFNATTRRNISETVKAAF
jgi:hypothetical protein